MSIANDIYALALITLILLGFVRAMLRIREIVRDELKKMKA